MRNFKPEKAPPGYTATDLFKQFLSQTGNRGAKPGEFETDAHEFKWRVLFVAGMWFQDLFNYDFRRTEMCIIPYGTQMGEISFCAYNTGVGWRNIVEQMLANATVGDWYKAARTPSGVRQEPRPGSAELRKRSDQQAARCAGVCHLAQRARQAEAARRGVVKVR